MSFCSFYRCACHPTTCVMRFNVVITHHNIPEKTKQPETKGNLRKTYAQNLDVVSTKLLTSFSQILRLHVYPGTASRDRPITQTSRMPRPSRRPNARASKRPSGNGGSSSREQWSGTASGDYPAGRYLHRLPVGKPGTRRSPDNWLGILRDDLIGLRSAEGSTKEFPPQFGIDTVYCGSMPAKKAGKWYRGILEAAERFMAR